MKYITNPNFLYIFTFSVPFLVYSLGWSTLYPELAGSLIVFYLITFLVCLIIGVIVNSIVKFKYTAIPEFKYNLYVIAGLFLFYLADIAYTGYIPLFAFTGGDASYETNLNYGIPTIHVIMVTFNVFFSLYTFHQYLSNKKFRLLVIYLLTIAPFVILLMRSDIMYILIGSLYISVISKSSFSILKFARIFILGLGALYIFGYLGNLRSANGDSTFIPRASQATDKFLDGWVPNEFYWGYLYIGSPIASLQNNINTSKQVKPNLNGFLLYECLPDFISKKMGPALGVEQREFNQLNDWLNVGTIYANSFSYLSWPGMITMFIYLIFLMNVYYVLISQSEMFKVTGYAMMANVIAFGNFSNTLQFSAFSFQLIYPVLISIGIYFYRQKKALTLAV